TFTDWLPTDACPAPAPRQKRTFSEQGGDAYLCRLGMTIGETHTHLCIQVLRFEHLPSREAESRLARLATGGTALSVMKLSWIRRQLVSHGRVWCRLFP